MNNEVEKALLAAGWKSGDAADLLGMNEEERQVLDARVQLAKAVRELRKEANLTQTELARRLKSTQPRVARLEAAASDVSVDQMFKALVAAGGRVVVSYQPRGGSKK